jgi:trimethylamine-N-oxide reductase (cytochrome c)
VVTDTLSPGVAQLREGGWYDPTEPGAIGALCKYGSENQVTLNIPSSKLAQATVAHTALVNVERYNGPDLQLTVFEPPKSAQI